MPGIPFFLVTSLLFLLMTVNPIFDIGIVLTLQLWLLTNYLDIHFVLTPQFIVVLKHHQLIFSSPLRQ